MSDLGSVQVIVRGYVQGVLFRDFTSRHAQKLGVYGYVRNLPGGRAVEVKAEGELEKLEELIGYLRTGPPQARVEKVAVSWTEYTDSFSHFGIRY